MRFSASQLALVTRQWGFKRFIAPQPAGAIWALVLMHSIPTHRANLTRPAGVLPFLTTQSAATTQPTVMPHSMAIQPVKTIPLTGMPRSLATRLGRAILPVVSMRSSTTHPATATLAWEGFTAGVNLTTGSNNIDIGAAGAAGESGRIRIGTQGKQTDTFIAGIYGATVTTGIPVLVGPKGKLGTMQSSVRFKEAIKPMDKASEALLALKPVTFRYKQELDPDGVPQFGLVAEEVEKVNPDLVVRGEDGKVMTVRYEAVNAMLLNEFLKEHRQVEEQAVTIAGLKAAIAQQQASNANQQKQIEALTAGLQKVTAQVESGKSSVKVAVSDD